MTMARTAKQRRKPCRGVTASMPDQLTPRQVTILRKRFRKAVERAREAK